MSDEPKKIDPFEGRWQPEAVVRLDEAKPKRPRSVKTAVWDIGGGLVSAAITAWLILWASDGMSPVWHYSALGVILILSISGCVEGVVRWLSRPRA
ncbi:MAG TPA: hypothetical protein VGP63_12300 [Planctomycetaceae bacterium]|nr:hypothetical protein [Planctomycetaceae bacterium]